MCIRDRFPRSGSIVSIVNTDFNDNWTGLFFEGTNGGFTLSRLGGCNFTGTDGLLPHYDLTSPDDGPWAFAGIHVIDMPFLNINSTTNGANMFNNLRNGILGESSNIRVNPNTSFERIADADYPIAGRAIRLIGEAHQLSVSGSNFSDCAWGIEAIGVRTDARSNTMETMLRGIIVTDAADLAVNISNGNTISATERCVWLDLSLIHI